MTLYKNALKKGWQLTTKHPFLWFFGLFAFLLGSNGGEIDVYLKSVSALTNRFSSTSLNFWQGGGFADIYYLMEKTWNANPTNFIFLVTIFLIAAFVLLYFIIISQIALISAASQTSVNEDKLTFSGCFHASHKHFWSILLSNVLYKVVFYLILFVFMLIFVSIFKDNNTSMYQFVYYVIAALFLIPLILVLSFLLKFTIIDIVVNQKKFLAALINSYQILKNNWLVSLEMSFIFFCLSIFLGIFVLFATLVMTAPFLINASISMLQTGVLANFLTVIMLVMFVFVVLFILSAIIFSSWQWTSWAYLYKELAKGKIAAKTVRLFQEK